MRWTGSAYVSTSRNFADFGYTLDGGTFVVRRRALRLRVRVVRRLGDPGAAADVPTAARGATSPARIPTTLKADAARWLKEYKKRRTGTRALGMLAAWVADEYRLGDAPSRPTASSTAELRAGRLQRRPGLAARQGLHLDAEAPPAGLGLRVEPSTTKATGCSEDSS